MERIIDGEPASTMKKEETIELAVDINSSPHGPKKQLASFTKERPKTELNRDHRAAQSREAP